jgi:hypothetical protein
MVDKTKNVSRLGDVYLETIARLEPDIAMIDPGAFYASAAISLKRIADVLERAFPKPEHLGPPRTGDCNE